MATIDGKLKEILTKFHPDPRSAVWDCHGKWVAYHAALEEIARNAKITFDAPQVLEANGPAKCAAICVTGRINGHAMEWSIGEAAPSNNKNGYPFAMAEKRAKDRVILKLIGLHGMVYSEEEADDFKGEGPKPDVAPALAPAPSTDDPDMAKAKEIYKRVKLALQNAKSTKVVDDILKVNAADLKTIRDDFTESYDNLMTLAETRKHDLTDGVAA